VRIPVYLFMEVVFCQTCTLFSRPRTKPRTALETPSVIN
jgi:hypothetical protein